MSLLSATTWLPTVAFMSGFSCVRDRAGLRPFDVGARVVPVKIGTGFADQPYSFTLSEGRGGSAVGRLAGTLALAPLRPCGCRDHGLCRPRHAVPSWVWPQFGHRDGTTHACHTTSSCIRDKRSRYVVDFYARVPKPVPRPRALHRDRRRHRVLDRARDRASRP